MTDLSKLKCVVYDHGMYVEIARRLGRELGKVYYATNWEGACPKIYGRVIGEGMEADNVHRVESLYDVLEEVDFAVFPDCHDGAMQLWIEKHTGLPVWGARRADQFELKKISFKRLLLEQEQPVPEFDVIKGLEALRAHLQQEPDRWLKTSPQYRGMQETGHVDDYVRAAALLAQMELDYGIMGDRVKFLSEKSIGAPIEGGIDTYVIDGQRPKVVSTGLEIKDRCYFLQMRPYADVDKAITRPAEFLFQKLKALRCRQFFSTEVKVTEDGESYFLEPTIRLPNPPGMSLMEVYGNLPQIMAQGAAGTLVEPECTAAFAVEATLEHTDDEQYPRDLKVPDSLAPWVKLSAAARVGDRYWLAPSDCPMVGSVIGLGSTPKEALEHLKDNAAALADQPVIIRTDALVEALAEARETKAAGIDVFENVRLPEPAAALLENGT